MAEKLQIFQSSRSDEFHRALASPIRKNSLFSRSSQEINSPIGQRTRVSEVHRDNQVFANFLLSARQADSRSSQKPTTFTREKIIVTAQFHGGIIPRVRTSAAEIEDYP